MTRCISRSGAIYCSEASTLKRGRAKRTLVGRRRHGRLLHAYWVRPVTLFFDIVVGVAGMTIPSRDMNFPHFAILRATAAAARPLTKQRG